MKNNKITIALLVLFAFAASVSAQSGGTFTITQSVVAGGGGQNAAGGAFSVDGTVAQAVAGNAVTGAPYSLTSGFWTPAPLSPTAAVVSVSGRVMTAAGRGLRNAVVVLTDSNGVSRRALSSSFGYYRFDNVQAGETYIVSISSKRFRFATPTIVLAVLDEIAGLDFIADPAQ